MRRLLLVLAACTGGHAPPDAMHQLPVDTPTQACADDGVFEPNDSIATAWPTPVGTTRDSIAIAGLAICPASDVDHYRVSLAATRTLRATAAWDRGVPVRLAILNAAGTPIADAPQGTDAARLCLTLPAGDYFAIVQTGTNTTNNYQLALELVPGC